MTPEIAQATAQFLQRVTLSPSEIEAFGAVMQALSAVVMPSSDPTVSADQSESQDA
tara:strand:+ start:2394 stop:2561 length:168 start_codon:yes stop_codon:yes gene_type:complete